MVDQQANLVLRLCSVKSRAEAAGRKQGNLYRQNEMPETQKSLFPIYSRLPKLDVYSSFHAHEASQRWSAANIPNAIRDRIGAGRTQLLVAKKGGSERRTARQRRAPQKTPRSWLEGGRQWSLADAYLGKLTLNEMFNFSPRAG